MQPAGDGGHRIAEPAEDRRGEALHADAAPTSNAVCVSGATPTPASAPRPAASANATSDHAAGVDADQPRGVAAGAPWLAWRGRRPSSGTAAHSAATATP